MRVFLFGFGNEQLYLGEAGTRQCNQCEKLRGFQYLLAYTYFHLWYVLGVVTEKKYLLICNGCNKTSQLEQGIAKAQFPTNPIPFMQRFGLLGFAGLILVAVVFGGIGAKRDAEGARDRAALRQQLIATAAKVDRI